MNLYLVGIAALLVVVGGWYAFAFARDASRDESRFDGQRALADVEQQVAFGPRVPESEAHARALDWMEAELTAAGWQVSRQQAQAMGHPITNLIAARSDSPPALILGAHYDTRLVADRDPDPRLRNVPGPGANDGASGVAVLLELARSLPRDTAPVMLVFFDAEDNGRIPGWDWILGSRLFVDTLNAQHVQPEAMILLDMVGDRDLHIRREAMSDRTVRESIWATAVQLGHEDIFTDLPAASILDDHVPFLETGIPAVDIIDLEYDYWHTAADTPDKVSANSLQVVGDVMWTWIVRYGSGTPGS